MVGLLINPYFLIRSRLWFEIEKVAPLIKGRVLDFGCGSKPYQSLFTSASSYVGVDVQESGHNHSQSKVDFYWDGTTLPFPDDSFDAVVAFEVFEHVFQAADTLEELRRVLRPGGNLVLSTPFMFGEHEEPFDFFRYTSFGILRLVESLGFEAKKLTKLGNFRLVLAQSLIDNLIHLGRPSRVWTAVRILLISAPINVIGMILGGTRRTSKDPRYFLNMFLVAVLPKKTGTRESALSR